MEIVNLKTRDNNYKEYFIKVFEPEDPTDKGFKYEGMIITKIDNIKANFKICFDPNYFHPRYNGEAFRNMLDKELFESLIRDIWIDKGFDNIKDQEIKLDSYSPMSPRIQKDKTGKLCFDRDSAKVAKENELARKLVLMEALVIQDKKGQVPLADLISKCHFYENSLMGAINDLKDLDQMEPVNENSLRLTGPGKIEAEKLFKKTPS